MKKMICIVVLCCLLRNVYAQDSNDKPSPKGKNNQVSLDLNIPFGGYLKDISNLGIGIEYSWSNGRFGKMASKPSNPIGFTFNTGADFYLGQKEDYGPYTVKYKTTTYLHAYGGAIYNPCSRGNISLTAGPSLERYDGNSEFGFGVNLSGSYYLCSCRSIGVSPNITFMKQGSSEAVFSGGIKLNYTF